MSRLNCRFGVKIAPPESVVSGSFPPPTAARTPCGVATSRAFCAWGFRGRKKVGGATVLLPEFPPHKSTEHFKRKARKNFGRRSAIEPVRGHLKSDFRLACNYLKSTIGDAVNLLPAAAAFNCRKWMNAVAEGLLIAIFALWAIMRNSHEPQFETA